MSESQDNTEKSEDESAMHSQENSAQIDINTWRNSRSSTDPDSPLMTRRRLSQGEQVFRS